MITLNKNYYNAGGTRYVFVDGNTCDSMEKCYATLTMQLNIPDYFGNNLDALEEVLADLEWVEEGFILILVLNKKQLLKNNFDGLVDVLSSCDNERVEVVMLGDN